MSTAISDSASEYARIKAVLCELADLPREDRVPEAERRLADEPGLRDRVLAMLRGLEADADFLEGDLPGLVGADTLAESLHGGKGVGDAHRPGATIGRFEILSKLGEGGMAVVYRARQVDPVEREVALKVISAHATDTQRLRFERECATLARLSHPNVATMFDSGVSNSGEPWAAMELVDGLPITQWCTQHRVGIEKRIRLFLDACRGISHAHRKGVLHRDVKPSNLLVADIDGESMTKVIDFGIAAALSPAADQQSNLTGRHLIGTPAYMSPESTHVSDYQALDARSDVFALGVVLFELLCGRRPFDAEDLSLVQWMAKLTSHDAPPMRQLFGSLGDTEQLRIAESAGTSVSALKRCLRSDLDLVVRKALALEPEQRYASSLDLAIDLDRYLRGAAVLAHPPNPVYRARKFLRRHWAGAGATTLLVLVLAAGLFARDREVQRTRLALAESDAVSEYLVDLLEHASPLRVEEEEVMLQDIIDRGAEQLGERFVNQPAVQARLLHTLGRIYGERGDYERGVQLMSRSLALIQTEKLEDDLERIELLSDMGVGLRRLGRIDEAEAVLLDGFALAESLAETQPLLQAEIANSLGNVYVIRRDWEKAERFHERALALREENLPAGDLDITSSLNNLATALTNSWQIERALPYAERVLQEWQQSLPPDHPWIGIARNNLAVLLDRYGQKEEALELNVEALRDAEARLGADHPDVADFWRNIAVVQIELGRREEAWASYRNHVGILTRSLGPDSARVLAAERRMQNMYSTAGRPEEALAGLDNIKQRIQAGDPNEGLLIQVELDRVAALIQLERYEAARSTLNQLIEEIERLYTPDSIDEFRAMQLDAQLIAAEGDAEEAVRRLENLETKARAVLPARSMRRGYLLTALAEIEFDRGAYANAEAWARKALEFWQSIFRNVSITQARILVGRACLEAGKTECAREELVPAIESFSALYGPDHPRMAELEADLDRLAHAD